MELPTPHKLIVNDMTLSTVSYYLQKIEPLL